MKSTIKAQHDNVERKIGTGEKMFSGKKIKEAEDRIQELELVETRYEKMTEDVQKIKDSTDEMFADLESQNMQDRSGDQSSL